VESMQIVRSPGLASTPAQTPPHFPWIITLRLPVRSNLGTNG